MHRLVAIAVFGCAVACQAIDLEAPARFKTRSHRPFCITDQTDLRMPRSLYTNGLKVWLAFNEEHDSNTNFWDWAHKGAAPWDGWQDTNAPSWFPNWTTNANGSQYFDGTSGFVDMTPYLGNVSSDTEGTIACWFNAPNTNDLAAENSNVFMAFADIDVSSTYLWFSINFLGRLFASVREGGTQLCSPYTALDSYTSNEWHLAVFTVGASGDTTNSIYLDGQRLEIAGYAGGSATTTAWLNDLSGLDKWYVGMSRDDSGLERDWKGYMSEIMYWSRPISSNEQWQLWSVMRASHTGTIMHQ